MTKKRRYTALLLTLFCTLSLLLASCGNHAASPKKSSMIDTNAKLSAFETATSTTGTGNITGDFVGTDTNKTAWVGLSSNGNRVVAFTTDGTQNKTPTFAQWFRGTIQNNTINTTDNAGNRLTANLTQDNASGTVTLKNGKTYPFTASSTSGLGDQAGLYRSERTINGTPYLAGWIVMPSGTSGTATPGATGTATTGPGADLTPGPQAEATVTSTPGFTTAVPSATATGTLTPGATETLTPGATGTSTMTAGLLPGGGAIINEKTNQLMQAPGLAPQDLSSKQITVPNLGTFNLRQCQQDQC